MRLMFVHYVIEDRGSAQDMYHYARVAAALGHEVALYGSPRRATPFSYSVDVDSADAVIFIFEWTTEVQHGDNLDLMRLVANVPRERRVVIDCDGKYNDAISVAGDANHQDAATSARWMESCESLSDKIYQPTLHPRQPKARPFFFHAYSPSWEAPLDFRAKDAGMVYVGNNWFRWRPMRRVLEAIAPVRDRVGPIHLVGHGWDSPGPWVSPTLIEDAYFTDPEYLRELAVDIRPPIGFDEVVATMGEGVFSPVIYRPLFDDLWLVTCRTFETPAANTLPLFCQDGAFVEEIYGEEALDLVLPREQPEDKILDLLSQPERYAGIVRRMRRHLTEKHSYERRLRELIRIVED